METIQKLEAIQKRETIQNHFFSDLSVMLGRSMRHFFRSMDTIITVTITPIAIMLLSVCLPMCNGGSLSAFAPCRLPLPPCCGDTS